MFLVFQGKEADVQSEPNPACRGAVCAGADWSLSTLAPTPTATSQKKDKQTENSARMHFIEGNNYAIIFDSKASSTLDYEARHRGRSDLTPALLALLL